MIVTNNRLVMTSVWGSKIVTMAKDHQTNGAKLPQYPTVLDIVAAIVVLGTWRSVIVKIVNGAPCDMTRMHAFATPLS